MQEEKGTEGNEVRARSLLCVARRRVEKSEMYHKKCQKGSDGGPPTLSREEKRERLRLPAFRLNRNRGERGRPKKEL